MPEKQKTKNGKITVEAPKFIMGTNEQNIQTTSSIK